jgi:hypothetical protein
VDKVKEAGDQRMDTGSEDCADFISKVYEFAESLSDIDLKIGGLLNDINEALK